MSKNRKELHFTGKFDSNARGFGFVTVEGFERDLFIPQGCTGGAVYGDTVEVKIIRGSLDESGSDDGHGRRAEAEVVRIVERGLTRIVGTFHPYRRPMQKQYYIEDAASARYGRKAVTVNLAGFVTPDNQKIPFVVEIEADKKAGALRSSVISPIPA